MTVDARNTYSQGMEKGSSSGGRSSYFLFDVILVLDVYLFLTMQMS